MFINLLKIAIDVESHELILSPFGEIYDIFLFFWNKLLFLNYCIYKNDCKYNFLLFLLEIIWLGSYNLVLFENDVVWNHYDTNSVISHVIVY